MSKYDDTVDVNYLYHFAKNGGIVFSKNPSSKEIFNILNTDPLVFFSSLERCLSNVYSKYFSKSPVSHKEFLFLLMLVNESENFNNISLFSYNMFLHRTTVGRNASYLKKKGYVDFSQTKNGRGVPKEIKLTDSGRSLVKKLLVKYEKIMKEEGMRDFLELSEHCKGDLKELSSNEVVKVRHSKKGLVDEKEG